jgi:toxin ParE1/3/4
MNLAIRLSKLAELDLEEIWFYTFATWSLNQANDYQDILFLGMNQLKINSTQAKYIKIDNRNFYYNKIGHHFIFFQQQENEILIYRVLHEVMDFSKHLSIY